MNEISEDARIHLSRVFIVLTLALVCMVIGTAAFPLHTPYLFIVSLAIISIIAGTKSTHDNAWWRSLLLCIFGFIEGVSIVPLINFVYDVDPWIPFKASVLTATIVVCFTVIALSTSKRHFLTFGGVLFSSLFALFALCVTNLWIRSPILLEIDFLVGIVLFACFIGYDIQLVIERAERGQSDSVDSALSLLLDIINLFIRIASTLAKNKKRNSNNDCEMV